MSETPQPHSASRRQRDSGSSAARRQEILRAAVHRFARQGYIQTDVQMIADDLKIGKGTVYRQFPTKAQLFLAAVDDGMQRLMEYTNAAAAAGTHDLQRIELGIRAYLEFFDQNPDIIELIIQERAYFRDRPVSTYFVYYERHLIPWKQMIQRLVDQGRMRPVAVERITDVASDLLYGTIFTNHFAGRRKSLSSQCEDVLDILFRGLLSDRGSQP